MLASKIMMPAYLPPKRRGPLPVMVSRGKKSACASNIHVNGQCVLHMYYTGWLRELGLCAERSFWFEHRVANPQHRSLGHTRAWRYERVL